MMRIFRWSGIGAFIVVVAIIAAVVFFFAETLVKNQLVFQAEKLNKAEVNIGGVELHYFPFGLALNQVQVTDAQQPSINKFQFESVVAKVDLWQYWLGRIVIDELSVDGLALNHARKVPGRLYQNIVENEPEEQLVAQQPGVDEQASTMDLPDAEIVLSDTHLLTVKNSKALQQSYQQEKANLARIKGDLPSKDKLTHYQEELNKLTKRKINSLDDLKQLEHDFSELKKQFKQDKATIKAAKQQLITSKNNLAPKIKALKQSPAQDWQQIEQKYQLDQGGSAAISQLLFGSKAGKYVGYVEQAYQFLKPLLAKDKHTKPATTVVEKSAARFIYFRDELPVPEFLLRFGLLELELPEGNFAIKVNNLTHQHWLQGKPTMIDVISENAGSVALNSPKSTVKTGKVNIHYQFSLTQQGDSQGRGQWQVSQYPLEHVGLMRDGDFTLMLDRALIEGQGLLANENSQLASQHSLVLSQTSYSGTTDSSLQKSVLKMLQASQQLSADVAVNGKLSSPDIDISSTLDDLFKDAIRSESKAKFAAFKTKVQAGLQQKLSSELSVSEAQFQQLETLLASFDGQEQQLDALLTSDLVKTKTDELKNKAKDKLKSKLIKLF